MRPHVVVVALSSMVSSGASCEADRGPDSGSRVVLDAGAFDSVPNRDRPRVFIANHGKLVGAFDGFAWIAAADGTRFDLPDRCDATGCFRGSDGVLCAHGWLGAREREDSFGPDVSCTEWAAKIGFDVHRGGGPWGPSAARYVAVSYRGTSGARLAAHRAGDGAREYEIEPYASGEFVTAGQLHSECGGREALDSFAAVDKFTLELGPTESLTPFDLCVTRIDVADSIDARDGADR